MDESVSGQVYARAESRDFGTSDADLKAYAETAGAAGGAAACTAMGAGLAAPICAEVGGAIAGRVYAWASSVFGGSDSQTPLDLWTKTIVDARKAATDAGLSWGTVKASTPVRRWVARYNLGADWDTLQGFAALQAATGFRLEGTKDVNMRNRPRYVGVESLFRALLELRGAVIAGGAEAVTVREVAARSPSSASSGGAALLAVGAGLGLLAVLRR